MKSLISALIITLAAITAHAAAIDDLASRVTLGTSEGKILFEEQPSASPGEDFFTIADHDGKVVISGNNTLSMAVGLNWYLKYVAGVMLDWNNPRQALPTPLPLPSEPITQTTDRLMRYYLNYCTFSYSMAFWDEERWMEELDWMALHGVNMPLFLTGAEAVWQRVLERMGYSQDEINEFVCGPAYMAWWLMNNLEGWGGPLPDSWYAEQARLAQAVVSRMHELGMEPVLPGYSGMVPRNIGEKLGYDVADPGLWCGFPRPAFLSPTDEHFQEMAAIYYEELTRLYGKSRYYAMDPFHEGGNTKGVDLNAAGQAIMKAMKDVNPEAVWVIQSWQENPRHALIDSLEPGSMVVLDLYSDKAAKWRREGVYGPHDWIYCQLLNFGGNVGLHGRMDFLIDGYYDVPASSAGPTLKGVGATPEGIENNPMMWELIYELPWRPERFTSADWLDGYLKARYGGLDSLDPRVAEAWDLLRQTVYNMPVDYPGQGTVESLLCARPAWHARSASTWGYSELFYDPALTERAATLLEEAYNPAQAHVNYHYDLVETRRQANADHANLLLQQMSRLSDAGQMDSIRPLADEFLTLILKQDSLLRTVPLLTTSTWIRAAQQKAPADDLDAQRLYRRNAAQLITVWGDSVACNRGGLHDYSHREWSGLLRELYYQRWKAFFDWQLSGADPALVPDFYQLEVDWVDRQTATPQP